MEACSSCIFWIGRLKELNNGTGLCVNPNMIVITNPPGMLKTSIQPVSFNANVTEDSFACANFKARTSE